MRRALYVLSVVLVSGCATSPPPAAPEPERAPIVAPTPLDEEKVIGTARVMASALNVRASASTEAEVVKQVKKGETVAVLSEDESWARVRLATGETGWVAARFLSRGGEKKASTKRKSGCPADSDYAFTETPMLSFSDSGAHGVVVVEATVNAKGNVTATRVVSNTTGDESLAFLTEREIKAARFSPPIRNCVPRSFIFTYRRTY
jgi:hypothetical protein